MPTDFSGNTFLKYTRITLQSARLKICDANLLRKKLVIIPDVNSFSNTGFFNINIGGPTAVLNPATDCMSIFCWKQLTGECKLMPGAITIENYTGELYAKINTFAPGDAVEIVIMEYGV